MPLSRRFISALCLLALAACAVPLSEVLTDQQPAPLQATRVTVQAQPLGATPAAAATLAPATAPLPLAARLPLAVWDRNGESLSLLPVDPTSGQVLEGAGWADLGSSYLAAYAPDGHTLALLIFDAHATTGAIRFVDLATWSMSDPLIALAGYPALMQFSDDGRSLIMAGAAAPAGDPQAQADGRGDEPPADSAGQNDLARYDVATGAELARVTLPFAPRSASLAPGGQSVLVYGTQTEGGNGLNPEVAVAQLDLAALTLQWQQALPGLKDGQYAAPEEITASELWAAGQWYSPAVVWSPTAAVLYLVHAESDHLTTVDFAAQSVRTVAIAPAQSWLDRLMALTAGVAEAKMLNGTTMQAVLSPDGSRLYVLGYRTKTVQAYTETPLGLRVVDAATGALLDTADTATRNLSLGSGAAGQPVLLMEGWGDRQWSEVRPLADPHTVLAEVRYVSLLAGHAPDGSPVLLAREDRAQRTVFHVINPATWQAEGQWPAAGFAQPLLLP